MPQFVEDVEEIRQRAIQKIEDGPVTGAYGVDKNRTIDVLNEALATEIVCVLRYMHHYFMATGVHGRSIADEFKEHADAERQHADMLAERIQQLGGKPDFDPKTLLQRSVSQYVEGETLADMIREDLIAERIVIEVYTQMIRFFGNNDPTTRHIIENILEDEEEHASELTDLLYIVDPHTGAAEAQDPGTLPLAERSRGEGRSRAKGEAAGRERESSSKREAAQTRQTSEARAEGRQERGRVGSNIDERGASQAAERLAGGTPRHHPREGGAQGGAGKAAGQRPGAPAANQPGAGGRPTRQRPQQMMETSREDEEFDLAEGGQRGGTRSVKVTRPNRKKRAA